LRSAAAANRIKSRLDKMSNAELQQSFIKSPKSGWKKSTELDNLLDIDGCSSMDSEENKSVNIIASEGGRYSRGQPGAITRKIYQ
jgi:hypothetical protein